MSKRPSKKLYGPHEVAHPATFSDGILERAATLLTPEHTKILDPFAGIGKIHDLGEHTSWRVWTTGIELAEEWADCHPKTKVGDATHLDPKWTNRFDAVVTSPCYGNRMADHHVAKDGSVRRSYTHDLGRKLDDETWAGAMHWHDGPRGDAYRETHRSAIWEMARVLRPGGLLILNMKDHIRGGERQYVTNWWVEEILGCAFRFVDAATVETPGHKAGANRDRVRAEVLLAFERWDKPGMVLGSSAHLDHVKGDPF
jgi:DNA modification methylase